MKLRRIPKEETIEAIQWTGENTEECFAFFNSRKGEKYASLIVDHIEEEIHTFIGGEVTIPAHDRLFITRIYGDKEIMATSLKVGDFLFFHKESSISYIIGKTKDQIEEDFEFIKEKCPDCRGYGILSGWNFGTFKDRKWRDRWEELCGLCKGDGEIIVE